MDHGDSDMETDRLLACLEQLKQFQESNNIVMHQKKPLLNHQESPVDNDYHINHHNEQDDDDKENMPYHSNNIFTKSNSNNKNIDKDNVDLSQYLIPSGHDRIEADEGEDVYDDEFEIYPLSDDENVIEPNLEKLQVLNAAPIDEEYLENAEKILFDIERYNIDDNVKMNVLTQLSNQIKMKSQEVNKSPLITRPPKEERFSPVQDACVTEYDPGIVSDDEDPVEEDPSDAIKVTKTFDQLLEERLAEEANKPINPVRLTKKAFLKRGQGIARFNGPPPQAKKPAKKVAKTETKQAEPKRVVGIIRSLSQDKPKSKLPCKVKMDHEPLFVVPKNPEKSCKKTTVMSPQRSPNGPKVRTPGRSNKTMARLTPKTTLADMLVEASPALSDVSALLPRDQVEEQLAQQQVELEEFRMLEQAAADKSMNSLMGLIHPASKVPTLALVEEDGTESSNVKDTIPINNIRISSAVEQVNQPLNQARQESSNEARQEPSNHTKDKLQPSSDYSEHNNEKIRDEFFEKSSNKLEHNSSFEFDDDGFEDDETWGFDITPVKPTRPSRVLSGSLNNTEQKVEHQIPAVQSSTDTAPSALLSKMFSGLRPAPLPPAPLPPPPDLEQESLKVELKTKLAELEKEVSRFQVETSKLVRVRNEKESALRRLREETDLFEKQQESEQKRFQEYKESEMKKIRAEKKQLEMSALSSVQRAAKLAEVDSLTVRVKELGDELSRKEGRWNTTHSRLKGRSEALEEECSQLRTQITVLERQKLELWEKEVERSSNRRHKSVQTEPPVVEVQTVGTPTSSLLTASCPELPLAQASGYNHGIPTKTKIPRKSPNPPSKSNIKQPSKSSSKPPPKCITKSLVCSEPLEDTETAAHTESVKKTLKTSIRTATPPTKDQTTHQIRPSEWDIPPVQALVSRVPGKNVQFFDSIRSPGSDSHNLHSSTNSGQKSAVQSMVVSSTCISPSSLLSPNSKGSVEEQSDGSQMVRYSNGTTKHISIDGGLTTVTYFNGDIKKTFRDGRVVYKFKEAGITHCRHSDGTEVIEFPSGQKEIKRSEGSTEIIFPDKSTRITYNDGREESRYADGTMVSVDASGQRLITLPNGQREVHTTAFKRREYPDGTTKTVFADGRQETRYSNGRLRRKDAQGNIVEDVYIK